MTSYQLRDPLYLIPISMWLIRYPWFNNIAWGEGNWHHYWINLNFIICGEVVIRSVLLFVVLCFQLSFGEICDEVFTKSNFNGFHIKVFVCYNFSCFLSFLDLRTGACPSTWAHGPYGNGYCYKVCFIRRIILAYFSNLLDATRKCITHHRNVYPIKFLLIRSSILHKMFLQITTKAHRYLSLSQNKICQNFKSLEWEDYLVFWSL